MISPTPAANRLPAFRARDAVIGVLQSMLAQENALGGENGDQYRFVESDPARSPVWICSPHGVPDIRDSHHKLITVRRGDYIPDEQGLLNVADQTFSGGTVDFRDLGTCMLNIECQATSETESEVMASICYHTLKYFRPKIMETFDLHSIRMMAISPPAFDDAQKIFVTTVMVRVITEEHNHMSPLGNQLNHMNIDAVMQDSQRRAVASLDATAQADA